MEALDAIVKAMQQATQQIPYTLGIIAGLFLIHILNVLSGGRLNLLGIWPRKPWGWLGIPFSPFLHGNFAHLLFNAFPLFIFATFVMLSGMQLFWLVSIFIVVVGGFLVWLLGRRGVHIGASTLIMGYLGFIVISVYHHPTPLSIVIALVTLIYFGGMFFNLLPSRDKRVSWEGHALGFVTGILAGYLFIA